MKREGFQMRAGATSITVDVAPIRQAGVTCPLGDIQENGEPHTIVGCGSTDVHGPDDEGLYDRGSCGVWFQPEVQS